MFRPSHLGILLTLSACLVPRAQAEMLPEPSLAAQYQSAEVVVVAEPLDEQTITLAHLSKVRLIVFSVVEVVKGGDGAGLVERDPRRGEADSQGPFLTAIVRTSRRVLPDYMHLTPDDYPLEFDADRQYLLFLNPTLNRGVFELARPEAGTTAWTAELQRDLKRLHEYLTGDYPPAPEWRIPEDAEEVVVPPSPHAVPAEPDETVPTRMAHYYLEGELVGTRTWYKSGDIALDQPMRLDRPHGPTRAWRSTGKLWSVAYHRDGDLHGYARQWKADGRTERTTFWIAGAEADEATYRQAATEDCSLPALPASDHR